MTVHHICSSWTLGYRLVALLPVLLFLQQEISLVVVRTEITTFLDGDGPQVTNFDNATTIQDDIIADRGMRFHISAYNRILQIVKDDTIISWGYKKAPGFPEELRIKYLLTPALSIERLHERTIPEKYSIWSNTTHHSILWESRICDAVRLFNETNQVKPHLLFTRCNENFGEFSRHVPDGKTADWDDMVMWTKNGCQSDADVFDYLDHRNTRAVFTTQHHFLDHPKVHSLPLGIKYTMKAQVLKLLREPRIAKTQLLMINDNGSKHRKETTATVIENFAKSNVTLRNTYDNKKSSSYLKELRRSKFILAPSGLGWDCYRIWEALHFGTIPIIERHHRPNDGWRRTLAGLPVLWVEDFSEVTPSMLQTEFMKIAAKASEYQYEKLTRQWWIQFIQSHIEAT